MSPDFRLIVKQSGNTHWNLTGMVSAQCTLTTDQGVGQAQFVIADSNGFVREKVGLHAMQVVQLWLKNRWNKWGVAWTGYIDAIHALSDPAQGDSIQITATSPLKLWEIQTLNSSSATRLALASIRNTTASQILQFSASMVGYPATMLKIDPVADSGTGLNPNGVQSAFTSPEAQTWASVIQSLLGNTGLEWFFAEDGSCYWRQKGYHLAPKGGYRRVREEELIAADLAESDQNVLTSIEVRYGQSGTQFVSTAATGTATMRDHLRDRYAVVYAPWIIDNAAAAQYLASVLLEQATANVLVGSVTLPADPGFQVGTVCEVPALRRTRVPQYPRAGSPPGGITRYYITSVSYQLDWGGQWVMTLGLGYGHAPGQTYPYLDKSFNQYPAATYEDTKTAQDLPTQSLLLNVDPSHPNHLRDVFTIKTDSTLQPNQISADPDVFPPGSTLKVLDVHGQPLDSDNPGGEYTAVAGAVGAGTTVKVHATRVSQGTITIIDLLDPPPPPAASGPSATGSSLLNTDGTGFSSTISAGPVQPPPSGSLAQRAYQRALNHNGGTYQQPPVNGKWEIGPDVFDCAGLVLWCYTMEGFGWGSHNLQTNADGSVNYIMNAIGIYQFFANQNGGRVISIEDALPGDLIFCGPAGGDPSDIGHVAWCSKAGGNTNGGETFGANNSTAGIGSFPLRGYGDDHGNGFNFAIDTSRVGVAQVASRTTGGSVQDQVIAAGDQAFGAGQGDDLWWIVQQESSGDPTIYNTSSGACGLFQRLPCPWNPLPDAATQIQDGIAYVKSRYGTPSAAKAFHLLHGWY